MSNFRGANDDDDDDHDDEDFANRDFSTTNSRPTHPGWALPFFNGQPTAGIFLFGKWRLVVPPGQHPLGVVYPPWN